MHFYNDKKDAEKLKSMIGDNPIGKQMDKEKEKDEKYEMFEAIDFLVSGARKLYMNDELKWPELCTSLCEAIEKLKDKEKSLKAMVPKKEDKDMPMPTES